MTSKLTLFIIWLAIVLCVLATYSCSEQRQTAKKQAWLIAHDKLDDICARVYPNIDSVEHKDSVHFDTLYVENDPIIKTDTVFKDDTVFITQTVKCPPEKVITKTLTDTVTLYRTNTAEVERWKGVALDKDGQIQKKDDIIIKQQQKIDKNNNWLVWFIILATLNVLGFVFRFFVIKRPI